jgi:hypothetical protein
VQSWVADAAVWMFRTEVQVINVHCSAVSSSLEVVISIIQPIQTPVTFILSLLK